MILITGANGTIGRQVVDQLAKKGISASALVRDLQKAKPLEMPQIQLVKGDFNDLVSLDAALAGAESAFLLTATSPNRLSQEANFIKAAKNAKLKHIVRLSIVGADGDACSRILRRHAEADRQLEDSGISFTILQPNYFMQNLLWYSEDIKTRGVFLSSLPETNTHAHVDARDIAAVAVATLTEAGHEGQIYRISGPEALTYGEMMQTLSSLLGKSVRYDASPDHYGNSLKNWGLDADEVLELDSCIAQGTGNGAAVRDTVLRVTKRQPIRFEQFAKDYLPAFGGQ